MDYIIIATLIIFTVIMIAQAAKIVQLADKIEDLEDENEELYNVGVKYKTMYAKETVMNNFREPLSK